MGKRPPPPQRDPQQTLETYLQPLIGPDAPTVADQLLARFGTIGRAIEASQEALVDALANHTGAANAICAARQLMQFAANEQLVGLRVDTSDRRFHEYLRAKLHNPIEERMLVIFLDRNAMFLAGENVASGTSGEVSLRVRPVVHRALDLGASGLLIAHNHPSGSCVPSDADYRSTERFISIASAIDLDIFDHLIVGQNGIYSMKIGEAL